MLSSSSSQEIHVSIPGVPIHFSVLLQSVELLLLLAAASNLSKRIEAARKGTLSEEGQNIQSDDDTEEEGDDDDNEGNTLSSTSLRESRALAALSSDIYEIVSALTETVWAACALVSRLDHQAKSLQAVLRSSAVSSSSRGSSSSGGSASSSSSSSALAEANRSKYKQRIALVQSIRLASITSNSIKRHVLAPLLSYWSKLISLSTTPIPTTTTTRSTSSSSSNQSGAGTGAGESALGNGNGAPSSSTTALSFLHYATVPALPSVVEAVKSTVFTRFVWGNTDTAMVGTRRGFSGVETIAREWVQKCGY